MSYENAPKIQFTFNQANNWTNQVILPHGITLNNPSYIKIISSPEALITIDEIASLTYEIGDDGVETITNTFLSSEQYVYQISNLEIKTLTAHAHPIPQFINNDINAILIIYKSTPPILLP